MPVQELETFRQKYPQYSDISDADLANKLADKYPAYSDLKDKVTVESPSFINQVKKAFMDTGKGIVNPPYRIAAHTLQGLEQIATLGKKEPTTYKNPLTGDVVKPYTKETKITEPLGLGLQGAAYLMPGTKLIQGVRTGATFGAGSAMEEKKNLPEIISQAGLGALIGGGLTKAFKVASGEPILTGKVGKAIQKVGKLPSSISRSIKKYKTLRKGSQFEGIRQDLTPMERVSNLEAQAKAKYGEPLTQEQTQLKQTLEGISSKEKVAIEKSNTAIKESKLKLSEDTSNLSSKMKEESTHLRDNIELASQKSAVEGKRRFGQFTKENSSAYGGKLDDVINIAEKEGTLPTKQTLQNIFDKTDAEIASTFIDTGAPLTKYNALKDKYLGGFASETNPEAQAIAKGLGFKKGQMKNAGIDWSRVDVGKSQISLPDANKPINLKGLLQDIRNVKKAMSAKGQGAERAFIDEDLVAIIFQKNVGEHMASTYPEFAKLQKSYAPIIEQMKAGRKIFKPGAPYELGTAPGILKEPNIVEKRLLGELEQGTPGFNKGLGEISQPVIKAQKKLAGTEKGYEIAKQRIEKLNAVEQKDLGELLNLREEAYKMAKEKTTVKSMIRQKQIKDQLEARLKDLRTGEFKGKIGISKLQAREKASPIKSITKMIEYVIKRKFVRIVP